MNLTQSLVLGATVFSGLLTGGTIDRGAVQMPAWREVGLRAWASYSRKADLGSGLFLYPFEGIGQALLSIAAVIFYSLDKSGSQSVLFSLYWGASLTILVLLLTLGAAPKMLSLNRIGDDDLGALQRAFDGF